MKTLFFNLKVFEKRIPCISCLIAMCLLLFFGSCSEQAEEFEVPEILDDAALVEAQLNQLHRTRANDAYSTVLITTAKSVNFQVAKTGRILVDWGDGNQEYDVFSHTYTDNFPAHTICFYDPDTTMTELGCGMAELIYLDITKNAALKKLNCIVNRLNTLDFSQNKHLEEVSLMANRLGSLDFSQNNALKVIDCKSNQLTQFKIGNNPNLEKLICRSNKLSAINVEGLTNLKVLDLCINELEALNVDNNVKLQEINCRYNKIKKLNVLHNLYVEKLFCAFNEIDSLNLSSCLLLNEVDCSNNQIVDLKISNQSALQKIYCVNNPFEKVSNAVLSFIQGLPNRTGKDKGSLSFSAGINDSGCLSTVQTFCTIFNWDLKQQ